MPEAWAVIRSMARWVLPVLVGPRRAVTAGCMARGLLVRLCPAQLERPEGEAREIVTAFVEAVVQTAALGLRERRIQRRLEEPCRRLRPHPPQRLQRFARAPAALVVEVLREPAVVHVGFQLADEQDRAVDRADALRGGGVRAFARGHVARVERLLLV